MQKKYTSLLILCMSLPTVTHTMYDHLAPDKKLLYASYEGNIQKAQEALNAGANPNFKEITGITALHQAALHGRIEIVKILLNAGADVNMQDAISRDTPLHWTVYNGHTEIVKLLLARGANRFLKNIDGKMPLDVAKEYGYQEIAQLLLN